MTLTWVAAAIIAAAVILTALGIRAEIRKETRADDADWLDPHATWLPAGHLDDHAVDARFDAIIAAEWPKETAE